MASNGGSASWLYETAPSPTGGQSFSLGSINGPSVYEELGPYLLGDPMNKTTGSLSLPGVKIATQDTVYGSFQTIDWLHDEAKERANFKRREYEARLEPWGCSWSSLSPKLGLLWYKSQGWLCALFIGVACGLLAGFIDVVSEFFTDLRTGHCSYAFWTSKRACCKLAESVLGCDAWVLWSESAGLGADGYNVGSWVADYVAYVAICVSLGALAASLVVQFAPYASGSGISEIKSILSGFVIRKQLGKWTFAIKTVCVPLAVATGLNLGKEGPLVHLTACVGNLMCYLFPKYHTNAARRRGMISAAASAGVSVAFGAPIGGVLFALEEVAYYFPSKVLWRGFFCSLVAATTLAVLDPFHTGKLVLFQTTAQTVNWGWYETPGFAAVGAIGGLAGAMFIKFNIRWCAVRKHTQLKKWPVTEVTVLALVTAASNYLCVFTRMDALELISTLFAHCDKAQVPLPLQCVADASATAVLSLVVVFASKIALMVFTSGIKVPAGVFVPAMAAGAALGRAYGAMVAYAFGESSFLLSWCASSTACIDPSVYAVCGAAAVLCGVSRMTIALVVIMFEITGGVSYLLPVMVTVLAAKTTADWVSHEDLYVAQIKLQEYPFLDPKVEYDIDTTIDALLRPFDKLECLYEHGNTVGSLVAHLVSTAANGFPVLTDQRGVIGYMSRHDLQSVVHNAATVLSADVPCVLSQRVPRQVLVERYLDLRPFMDPTPIAIVHTTPFSTACDIMKKTGARYMIVTRDGVCAGIVTRKDILAFIHVVERDAHIEVGR